MRVILSYESSLELWDFFRATLEVREISPGKRGNIFKFLSSNLIVQGYRKMLYLQEADTLWTKNAIGPMKSEWEDVCTQKMSKSSEQVRCTLNAEWEYFFK